MCRQRKKIGFLCLLLIISGGWIAFASRQAGQAEGVRLETSGASAVQPSASSLVLHDPNLASPASGGLGSGELFFKMMLSVGLVIGLGGAALYLSKRVLPRVVHTPGKEIHILETAYLGPRKALHLVEVSGQRLLIASTSDNITMLAPVNEAWLDLSKQELGETVKA